jgi:hypothetical protein
VAVETTGAAAVEAVETTGAAAVVAVETTGAAAVETTGAAAVATVETVETTGAAAVETAASPALDTGVGEEEPTVDAADDGLSVEAVVEAAAEVAAEAFGLVTGVVAPVPDAGRPDLVEGAVTAVDVAGTVAAAAVATVDAADVVALEAVDVNDPTVEPRVPRVAAEADPSNATSRTNAPAATRAIPTSHRARVPSPTFHAVPGSPPRNRTTRIFTAGIGLPCRTLGRTPRSDHGKRMPGLHHAARSPERDQPGRRRQTGRGRTRMPANTHRRMLGT